MISTKKSAALMTAMMTIGVTLASVAVAPAADAQVRYYRRERHPQINRAIRNLQQARTNVTFAARDFGGHRANAAKLIQQAINELNRAKQYDNTH